MTEPFNQFLPGSFLRYAGSRRTLPASVSHQKPRSTILARLGARSICHMTLRYSLSAIEPPNRKSEQLYTGMLGIIADRIAIKER
jgi:hypothetical protein